MRERDKQTDKERERVEKKKTEGREREVLTYNGDHPHHEVGEEREPD